MKRFAAFLFVVLVLLLPAAALDRNAWTITRSELQVRVHPETGTLDVDGKLTVRNDAAAPQKDLSLQISSTLTWRSIKVGGEPVAWLSQPYTSDIDHSGSLSEAIITLATPVAPGKSEAIEVHYVGSVPRTSTRLTRIGTPEKVAVRSDWDQISREFTAIRGLGYVVWYPVSIEAVSLSNGSEVWDAIARWKERNAEVSVKLAPVEGAHTFAEGGSSPVIAVLDATITDREHLQVIHTAEHTNLARDFVNAFEKSLQTTTDWFGTPKRKVTIIELTDSEALPYDSGTVLLTPLRQVPPLALEVGLARIAARASLESRRPWIREGLATFAQALVREKQQGRTAGLAYLNQFVNALATAEAQPRGKSTESSSKPQGSGAQQPLISTNDELFFRTKAAFVWWMLRDTLGDDTFKIALSRYKEKEDKEPSYVQRLFENVTIPKRDLEAFFDTWVYRDNGIANVKIDSVYPRKALSPIGDAPPTYNVVITVENVSAVWVNVPVLVRGGGGSRVERLAVPPGQKAVSRIAFPSVPQEVIVNDGSIPEAELSDNYKKVDFETQQR